MNPSPLITKPPSFPQRDVWVCCGMRRGQRESGSPRAGRSLPGPFSEHFFASFSDRGTALVQGRPAPLREVRQSRALEIHPVILKP